MFVPTANFTLQLQIKYKLTITRVISFFKLQMTIVKHTDVPYKHRDKNPVAISDLHCSNISCYNININ